MSTELTVAVIAATVSLASALVAVTGQLRIARLSAAATDSRERRSQEAAAQALVARYRDPLSAAAFELQSRIYNLLCGNILDRFYRDGTPREREYVVESTLYVFGQYFAWTEIIRREVQFLDLRDVGRTRRLAELETQVSQLLLDSAYPPPFRVFRTEQRAIGELMIDDAVTPARCIGPATFRRRRDPDFRDWFEDLETDTRTLASSEDRYVERLALVQNALVELIDFLDAPSRRFAPSACQPIPPPPRPVTASTISSASRGASDGSAAPSPDVRR